MRRQLTNRIRNRASCLIVKEEKLLLVKQNVPTRNYPVWMPPGGEVDFGETIRDAAIRETQEETGIVAEVKHLAAIHEFIEPPFHAVEFYFYAEQTAGELITGSDPEMEEHNQRIVQCKFIPIIELRQLALFPSFLKNQTVDFFQNMPIDSTIPVYSSHSI